MKCAKCDTEKILRKAYRTSKSVKHQKKEKGKSPVFRFKWECLRCKKIKIKQKRRKKLEEKRKLEGW